MKTWGVSGEPQHNGLQRMLLSPPTVQYTDVEVIAPDTNFCVGRPPCQVTPHDTPMARDADIVIWAWLTLIDTYTSNVNTIWGVWSL